MGDPPGAAGAVPTEPKDKYNAAGHGKLSQHPMLFKPLGPAGICQRHSGDNRITIMAQGNV